MAASDTRRFLLAFLRHPSTIGAVAPSSKALALAMCRELAVGDDELVLEFGPGTGPFTAQLQRCISDPACYLGIERDVNFVRLLQERYPDLTFVAGSAEQARQLHGQHSRKAVGSIISGLPFTSLPPEIQDGVIGSIDHLLPPGGEFRTFQYVHAYALPAAVRFRRRMEATFGPRQPNRLVMGNLPPAFVLSWKRASEKHQTASS